MMLLTLALGAWVCATMTWSGLLDRAHRPRVRGARRRSR
jgi:hypothetical protein